MKKIVTGFLTLALLAAMTTASASQAGSVTDPLVTNSYASGKYAEALSESLLATANSKLQAAYNAAVARIGSSGSTGTEGSSGAVGSAVTVNTPGKEAFILSAGGFVTVSAGCSFTMTSGAALLAETSGDIIDVTTGAPVPAGTALGIGHRYIVTESALAQVSASRTTSIFLAGPYTPGTGFAPQFADYTDVSGSEWYADAAAFAREKKLFHDYASSRFNGEADCVRAEMVYALWTIAGCPAPSKDAGFTDLTEDWYLQAVNWAAETGITTGISKGESLFDPKGVVSRSQMAAFVYRFTALNGGQTDQRADLSVYKDYSTIDDWEAEPVSWATAVGIINGMGDGTMSPKLPSSRAQAATVIMRFNVG